VDAKIEARAHGERKFLGLFNHQAAVCTLHDKSVASFRRKLRL
jgi:hypothetical protein